MERGVRRWPDACTEAEWDKEDGSELGLRGSPGCWGRGGSSPGLAASPGCDSARHGQLASYVNPLMVNLERGNGKADLPNSCPAPGASEMIPPEAQDAALSAQVGQASPRGSCSLPSLHSSAKANTRVSALLLTPPQVLVHTHGDLGLSASCQHSTPSWLHWVPAWSPPGRS